MSYFITHAELWLIKWKYGKLWINMIHDVQEPQTLHTEENRLTFVLITVISPTWNHKIEEITQWTVTSSGSWGWGGEWIPLVLIAQCINKQKHHGELINVWCTWEILAKLQNSPVGSVAHQWKIKSVAWSMNCYVILLKYSRLWLRIGVSVSVNLLLF